MSNVKFVESDVNFNFSYRHCQRGILFATWIIFSTSKVLKIGTLIDR